MARSKTWARAKVRSSGFVLAFGAVLLASGLSAVLWPDAAGAEVPSVSPTMPSWCLTHGSAFAGWTGTTPNLPICGPGPAYGGTWAYVDLPGPYGAGGYYNATPGFQCVELAERYLAMADGLAPVMAEGSTVAENYHAAYPTTGLVVNGSAGAVGHPPTAGDVVSFSEVPSFADPSDGHVAIVVRSSVAANGDGTVTIAQQNVASSAYVRVLSLVGWRLEDPTEPGNAEWQYPYAEWLEAATPPVASSTGETAHVRHRHERPARLWNLRDALAAGTVRSDRYLRLALDRKA